MVLINTAYNFTVAPLVVLKFVTLWLSVYVIVVVVVEVPQPPKEYPPFGAVPLYDVKFWATPTVWVEDVSFVLPW